MTSQYNRMCNTARARLAEGMTEEHATDYISAFYGITFQKAQIIVLDVSRPGGFAAWMTSPEA